MRVPFVGPSAKARGKGVDEQYTQNFYIEQQQDGRGSPVLYSFPTNKEAFDLNSVGITEPVEAMHVFQEKLYIFTENHIVVATPNDSTPDTWSISELGDYSYLNLKDVEDIHVADNGQQMLVNNGMIITDTGTLFRVPSLATFSVPDEVRNYSWSRSGTDLHEVTYTASDFVFTPSDGFSLDMNIYIGDEEDDIVIARDDDYEGNIFKVVSKYVGLHNQRDLALYWYSDADSLELDEGYTGVASGNYILKNLTHSNFKTYGNKFGYLADSTSPWPPMPAFANPVLHEHTLSAPEDVSTMSEEVEQYSLSELGLNPTGFRTYDQLSQNAEQEFFTGTFERYMGSFFLGDGVIIVPSLRVTYDVYYWSTSCEDGSVGYIAVGYEPEEEDGDLDPPEPGDRKQEWELVLRSFDINTKELVNTVTVSENSGNFPYSGDSLDIFYSDLFYSTEEVDCAEQFSILNTHGRNAVRQEMTRGRGTDGYIGDAVFFNSGNNLSLAVKDKLFVYSLSTPYNLNTLSLSDTFDVQGAPSGAALATIAPSGKAVYYYVSGQGEMQEHVVAIPFDFGNITFSRSIPAPSGQVAPFRAISQLHFNRLWMCFSQQSSADERGMAFEFMSSAGSIIPPVFEVSLGTDSSYALRVIKSGKDLSFYVDGNLVSENETSLFPFTGMSLKISNESLQYTGIYLGENLYPGLRFYVGEMQNYGSTCPDADFSEWDNFKPIRVVSRWFPEQPGHISYMDGFFLIVDKENTGRFRASALYDGNVWPAFSFATAERKPDALVSIQVSGRELWLVGEQSAEVWYNAGNPIFPFVPSQQGFLESGAGHYARHTVLSGEGSTLFLGRTPQGESKVYSCEGLTAHEASNRNVESQFFDLIEGQSFENNAIASAMLFQYRGHLFYVLNIIKNDDPTDGISLVFDGTNGSWVNIATPGSSRWCSDIHEYFRGYHLFSARAGMSNPDGTCGQITYLSEDISDPGLERIRRSPYIFFENRKLRHYSVEVEAQVEDSLVDEPVIYLRWSDDNGRTWTSWKPRVLQDAEGNRKRTVWRKLGSSRNRVYELKVDDPVNVTIVNAWASLMGFSSQAAPQEE